MIPVDSIETNTSLEAVHETRAFRPPLRSQLIVAGALVGALLVAGCGSREAEGSSPTPQSSPTESTGSASTSPSVPSSPMPTNKPGSPESTSTPTPSTSPTQSNETPKPVITRTPDTTPSNNVPTAEQIEMLAPTLETHKTLNVYNRILFNYIYYKYMYESGDMSTYLSWTLYKEKTATGELVDDEDTSIYNYNPVDPEGAQTPNATCEQIRQEYLFKLAMLTSVTNNLEKFYDESNPVPLNKELTERLIDGMYVQPFDGSAAAEHYDATVFNYTTAYPNATPNPFIKRIECQSTKDIKPVPKTLTIGSVKVDTLLKKVVFKLKDSGTVYDATFAYFNQPTIPATSYYGSTMELSTGGTWLIYSFDKRS